MTATVTRRPLIPLRFKVYAVLAVALGGYGYTVASEGPDEDERTAAVEVIFGAGVTQVKATLRVGRFGENFDTKAPKHPLTSSPHRLTDKARKGDRLFASVSLIPLADGTYPRNGVLDCKLYVDGEALPRTPSNPKTVRHMDGQVIVTCTGKVP